MATKCACSIISLTPMSMTPSKPDLMHRTLFSRLLSSRSSINPKFLLNGALKSSNIVRCLPFDVTSVVTHRPGTGNFHPSVWNGHIFLSSTSDLTQDTQDTFHELKKEVKSILSLASNDLVQELDLIDQIQRLGVAYHFEPEIEGALRRISSDDIQFLDYSSNDSEHLYAVSLRFRLLRQAGYYVSPDVFKNFKDKKGEFSSSLASDARCMLSLYQASYLGFNGEPIMDEAMAFSTKHLKSMLLTQLNPALESEIQSALQIPLLKTMERVQAREYITAYYKMNDSRNETLLKFATLDFNILQSLHQKEVSEVKCWWDDMNIKAKLPFQIRDRVVEGYCMLMATYFEPQYSSGRILLAKIYSMLSVLDDAFDVYGNLEELAPLTETFQRWDGDVNYLTEHMRIIFKEVLNVFNGIEGERMTKGERNGLPYLIEAVKDYTKGLWEEAKILYSGEIPTLEEWLPVSMVTVAINIFVIAAVMNLGEAATKEVFDWIASKPKMIRCSYLLNRLLDDIATFKGEQKRGILLSTVTCCMKDRGISESNAIKYLQDTVTSSWKDMNEERFKPNLAPSSVTKIIFNISAIIELYYVGGVDGYTNSNGRTRDIVASLLVHPLPI